MEGRTPLQWIWVTLKGVAMGAADVVPGVSGGTIAFISGIYEELINSINQIGLPLFKTLFKQGPKTFWEKLNGNFLLALFTGIAISVISLSKFVSWALENHPVLLWSFFFGLVFASIFLVGKEIQRWSLLTLMLLILGASVAYIITSLPISENSTSLPYLFFSGAMAVCAMILPGISGAFILVLMGSYKTILDAVHELDIITIVTVGSGAVIGLVSFARLLKWMFQNFKDATLALLTGFILGSLNKIWPWKKVLETKTFGDKIIPIAEQNVLPISYDGNPQFFWAITLALFGFGIIFILEKISSKKS